MNKTVLAALVVLVTVPARAALPVLDVPPYLVAFVMDKTGVNLPLDLKIYMVENDDTMFAGGGEGAERDGAESNGKIYLPIRVAVHLQEPQIQALVVHELTHVAQELSGKTYSCRATREAEAYAMQNQYLSLHNLPVIIRPEGSELCNN
jgi:hypothetical protein